MSFLVACSLLFHPWWEVTPEYMQAHTTTNAPSFEITAWAQHGWVRIEWCRNLGDEWECVAESRGQIHGLNTYTVYMHPKSPLTTNMMYSAHGFFRCGTPYAYRVYGCDVSPLLRRFSGPSRDSMTVPFKIKQKGPPLP